jgi:hypothetical protein
MNGSVVVMAIAGETRLLSPEISQSDLGSELAKL